MLLGQDPQDLPRAGSALSDWSMGRGQESGGRASTKGVVVSAPACGSWSSCTVDLDRSCGGRRGLTLVRSLPQLLTQGIVLGKSVLGALFSFVQSEDENVPFSCKKLLFSHTDLRVLCTKRGALSQRQKAALALLGAEVTMPL